MSDKKIQCTIGTDPEFFLKLGGKYVASQTAGISGTKEEPAVLPSGGTIQRDNVAVEFATPPAKTAEEFVEKIRACFRDAHGLLSEGYELTAEPSATFDEDQLQHEETLQFGCDPDFNAYSMEVNEKPWCGDSGFRSCGGHIHVGCLDDAGKPIPGLEFLMEVPGKVMAVKAMDLFHGTISTLIDNSEAAIKRRELYGQAGCHRPTPYGVEYRVLSNFWMKSPQLVMLMDSLTRDAMAMITEGKLSGVLDAVGEFEIQSMINEGKVDEAEKILQTHVVPNLSPTSLDLLAMCQENLPKYKSVREEWGI